MSFERISRLAGIAALLLFLVAQYQGWGLFDDSAQRHSGSSSSSRVYHK